MKNSISLLKKIIFWFCFVTILILITILVFDYINITKYISFTRDFDWLNLLGAIVGGLIGSLGTFIGIYLTIKNDKESNDKKLIEEIKRNGYSYLTFNNTPINLTLALDSQVVVDNIKEYTTLVIGENVKADLCYYCNLEFLFTNMNTNYPSGVILDELIIMYGFSERDNKKQYSEVLNLKGYGSDFKNITIMNGNIVAFSCTALLNEDEKNNINSKIINDERIDIQAKIRFITPNGVVTSGKFSANLVQNSKNNIGNKKNLGSNKLKITYDADNTYFIIDKIDFIGTNNED